MLPHLPSGRQLIILAFFFGILGRTHAADIPSAEEFPTAFDDRFSTNWYNTVRLVVPRSYTAGGTFDFQKATNALWRESRHHNVAAKALWGMAVVVTSRSAEDRDTGMQLLRDSAAKGYVPAMVTLGYLYEGGKYVRIDYSEAFNWFKQAADVGSADAELQLGGCYHYGLGVPPDTSTAIHYYRLAAEQTNYVAMKSLGYLLMNSGEAATLETNKAEARHWFLRAANEGGNRRAMFNLGTLCCAHPEDTNSMREAFKWMKQAAELGDALAANETSHFYYWGWGGVETNLASYHYWVLKAAFLGATEAQYMAGQMYRIGDGVPTNVETSLFWYRKAAAKNHPGALYELALRYREDKTNRASLEMASSLMLRAAQMGHREAQFQCGLRYWQDDATQDCDAGRAWMTKAAENGWFKAEFFLFQAYYHGSAPARGCPRYPKDKAEGVKWLRRAAEHGSWRAQSMLAVMMIQGKDVDQNKVEAEKMLRASASYGFGQSQGDLGFAIFHGDASSTNLVEAAMWCHLALTHSTDTNVLQRTTYNLAQINGRLTSDQQQEAAVRATDFQILPAPFIEPRIKDWEENPKYQREDGHLGH